MSKDGFSRIVRESYRNSVDKPSDRPYHIPCPAMGPFVFTYSALAGFFACAGLYHLLLWWSSRRERLLGVFSAECFVQAGLSVVLVLTATSTTPESAHAVLRVRTGLTMLQWLGWLWCAALVSGVRARWFVWPATAAFGGLFLINLVTPLNQDVLAIGTSVLPWGETIAVPQQGPGGPWAIPVFGLFFAVLGFGMWCGIRLWVRDRVAGVLVLLVYVLAIPTLLAPFLRVFGNASSVPFFGVVASLPWVVVFALLIARQHRHVREQLVASERRFRAIFNQTSQLVVLLNPDGVLMQANDTALEFSSIGPSEVVGHPFWDAPWWVRSPELTRQLQAAVQKARTGETVRLELQHRRADGATIAVDFSLHPILDDDGRVVLLLAETLDVTERKRAEDTRRDLESRLAQSQKMEAIGQLASGIAHDFNNLLTVIGGNSEILREGTPRGDPAWPLLDAIHAAGERAAALTRQLLMFSRKQIVEPRLLDLNAVVGDTRAMLERLIGEDISVRIELDPDLAAVIADPGQVSQVLLNLAVNARDAMPRGGTMTIATAMREIKPDAGNGNGPRLKPGQYVVLSVSDTGVGMTTEVQKQIFEPFFTTKAPGKGTGLGLATVRTIVDELNGAVLVSSAVGQGSTFSVLFTAQNTKAAPPVETPPPVPVPRAATVLVVEDEASVRTLIHRKLSEAGYVVFVASGGNEALRLAREHRGELDLLITDVVMPDLGGRELAEQLRREHPALKVLFLSGYTDDMVLRHGLAQAEVAFLQKPFTMSALLAKVRAELER